MKKILLVSTLIFMTTSVLADDETQMHSGPLQFGVTYSNEFGTIFDSKWVNYVTPRNAFAFELDYGGQEFRIGGTWGMALTTQQRLKLTGEHLAQKLDFDFASGTQNEWEGQNAISLAYQYLLNRPGLLQAFNAQAYYSNAEDQSFDPITYVDTNSNLVTNNMNVAGGIARGGSVGIQLQSQKAQFKVDLNYDDVTYDTIYETANDTNGFGITLNMQRLFTDHFKMGLLNSFRTPANMQQLSASWLVPSKPGTRLELGLAGSRLQGSIPTGSDYRVTLGVAYSWGGDKSAPALNYRDTFDAGDLSAWTNVPAVHMPAVLAQTDESVVAN